MLCGATVSLKKVFKKYGDVLALKEIDLEIKAGEFLTLLGPSGSGKTTTLMIIAGFEQATSGEISVDGQQITAIPPHKRGLGMVFQHYSLFPHMTVAENIAFPLEMRKMAKAEIKAKVAEVLKLVELDGMGTRYPKQLSGGQQQRVALARALVFKPRVLLMDEPLGALDKKLREQMQLEIKRIQQKLRITTIFVTHDQEEAMVMSDRIVVMNDGGIEQLGSPQALYDNPVNRFVAQFLGDSNFFKAEVTAIQNDGISLKVQDQVGVNCKDGRRHSQLQAGREVTLAIRPEKLCLTAAEHAGYLAGTVQEVIFVGNATKYFVAIDNGGKVCALEQNNQSGGQYRVGDKVQLSWSDEHARVLLS